MRYTRDHDTYVIRFEDGEVVPDSLVGFLQAESIGAASLTGIGAFSRTRIAYFDIEKRAYLDIDLDEQLEVLAFVGNVALHEGEPLVHAHVTLGRRDGTALGGHLREGVVRPTLELTLHVNAAPLPRVLDPKYGLPALDLKHKR